MPIVVARLAIRSAMSCWRRVIRFIREEDRRDSSPQMFRGLRQSVSPRQFPTPFLLRDGWRAGRGDGGVARVARILSRLDRNALPSVLSLKSVIITQFLLCSGDGASDSAPKYGVWGATEQREH